MALFYMLTGSISMLAAVDMRRLKHNGKPGRPTYLAADRALFASLTLSVSVVAAI